MLHFVFEARTQYLPRVVAGARRVDRLLKDRVKLVAAARVARFSKNPAERRLRKVRVVTKYGLFQVDLARDIIIQSERGLLSARSIIDLRQ